MAEGSKTKEHIFRLSSIDQWSERVYIRYSLCFACENDDIDKIARRLITSTKHTILHLPILAGTVRPTKAEDGSQRSRVDVVVTLDNISNFKPIIKSLGQEEFAYTYQDLEEAKMPPNWFINESLTPLPDRPDHQAGPVFAIQANFLAGGVIIALYLHHSVADIIGLQAVVNQLSNDLPYRELSDLDLAHESLEQSRTRDRLSGSRGAKPNADFLRGDQEVVLPPDTSDANGCTPPASQATCHVLFFDTKMLGQVKDIVNNRFSYIHTDHPMKLSSFDVIAAILWKAISRARNGPQSTSTISIPVNIRRQIEPALDDLYFGNAFIHAFPTSPVAWLSLNFDAGTLAHTARLIGATISTISEDWVRSTIASVNESMGTQPGYSSGRLSDVVIDSWANMDIKRGSHLGLGLGEPGWIRQVGRDHSADGCIINPPREDALEVMVQLPEETMDALLQDESLLPFIRHVA